LNKIKTCIASIGVLLFVGPVHALTIDSITISTVDGCQESYGGPGSFNRFGLLGVPYLYNLSDGRSLIPGAGWIPYTNGTVTNEDVHGGEIDYTFGDITNWAKGDGVLFYHVGQVWDETPTSALWTEGELTPVTPLVLRAELGGTTATLSGEALVAFNNSSNRWGDPANFVPYAADEGHIVHFETTYTLADGATWARGTFDSAFSYNMIGTISMVPEPDAAALIVGGIGLLMALSRRRGFGAGV